MKTLILNNDTFNFDNESVRWIVSKGINKIKLKGNFNKPIDTIPSCIRILYIDTEKFDQKIKFFPHNLKKLIISHKSILNKIDNNLIEQDYLQSFPQSLEYLKLFSYKKSFPDLPLNLIHLEIIQLHEKNDFSHLTKLKYLKIHSSKNKIIKFPPNLLKLNISEYEYRFDNLPESLTHLECSFYFSNNTLPAKLKHLMCVSYVGVPFKEFPKELTHLELIWRYEEDFYDNNEKDIFPQLPKSLFLLKINNSMMHNYKINLPVKLKKLFLVDSVTVLKDYTTNLPKNLEELSISYFSHYNPEKYKIMLPEKIKKVQIFDSDVSILNFPSSIKHLSITDLSTIQYVYFETIPSLNFLQVSNIDFLNYNLQFPCIKKLRVFLNIIIGNKKTEPKYNSNILSKIPNSVIDLDLEHFDIMDYSLLPSSIKNLTLNINSDTTLSKISDSIINLKINAYSHNLEIQGFSLNLKKISINANSINNEILNHLPNGLEYLQLKFAKSNTSLNNLPNSIKFLDIDLGIPNETELLFNVLEKLPESLVYFKYIFSKNKNIDLKKFNYGNFPKSLKTINFCREANYII